MMNPIPLLLTIALLLVSETVRANWNQFRGPGGDGNAGTAHLPVAFSDTKNVRWRTAIHDQGHASPVIWGDQIWLTSGNADSSRLFAICVDLSSGKIIHDIEVFSMPVPELQYPNLNSPASPTPYVEDGRVYVHFGSFGTACLDTKTGEKLWERTDLRCDHRVRAASSPIVDEDLLYLTFDGVDVQYFIALNKFTGETVWRQDRSVKKDYAAVLRDQGVRDVDETMKEKPGDNRKSYATPTIIEHAGRRQVISPAAEVTYSYNARTGEELWHVLHPGFGFNVTCRPIYQDGLLYFTTGISKNLFAVNPDGKGNVTETHVQWKVRRGVSHLPSFVIENDLLFMISDQSGLVNCLDAKTGEQIWQERLRAGREHWASPIVAGNKIFFSSKSGEIAVIEAEREYKVLARNKIEGTIHASPAVSGNALIIRSGSHLYHIAQGYETAPQEKRPEEIRKNSLVKQRSNGSHSLLAANAYFLGGKTNKDGKFEATFIIESDGDKSQWPTITLRGDQFRDTCADLEKYHKVTLNLTDQSIKKSK